MDALNRAFTCHAKAGWGGFQFSDGFGVSGGEDAPATRARGAPTTDDERETH